MLQQLIWILESICKFLIGCFVGSVSSFVKSIREKAEDSPAIYAILYNALTLNRNFLKLRRQIESYPSKFGGFWTDREDYRQILDIKLQRGIISETEGELFETWRKNGFVVLENAVRESEIDALVNEICNLPKQSPLGLKITGGKEKVDRPYKSQEIKPHDSIRIVDFYYHSAPAREILLNEKISLFLEKIFEEKPLLTQSLSFEYGSEQEIHQDTAFVVMNSPLMFVGVWVALEDVQEGSGELIYYPGSHLWGDWLFSNRFRHFNERRDGKQQLIDWEKWMHGEAKKRNISAQKFMAKKGDVLVWHSGLAHGGSQISSEGQTRRSIVGHYCPVSVVSLSKTVQ